MGRLNLTNDEASLLKTYKLSTLSPTRWEDIDHDALDSVAGGLTNPQGDIDTDPLGLRASFVGSLDKLDLETKASILISSKSFDPKAFLSYAYPNATHQDLTIGVSNLSRSIDARAEAVKILVEENIDRFVAVKASSDAVFAEMKEGLLADDTEFASKTLRDKLKQASMKADQVFLPVLENASKANKVRSTLGVFERSKFFFNLPGSLMEAIQEGKYETALRDYKKGKYMMSRPSQLLPNIPVNENESAGKQLELQQKRIFDKLWSSIEKVMLVMRTELLKKLKEPGRPVEEQEKILEVLLDLGSTNGDDPVWIFFDNQHNHITTLMKAAHKTQLVRYEDARRTVPADAISPDVSVQHAYIAAHLKTCLSAIGTPLADNIIAKAPGSEVWQTIVDMVHNVSEVMLANLPSFWKIGKSYIDGKFRKDASSRRSPTQVRTMTADIIKTYIFLLSDFFVLSDMAVTIPSPAGIEAPEPSFLPPGCNSLTTGFYLGRIYQEINDCVTELLSTDMSGDSSTVLKELLDSARWKFLDVFSYTWTRDMRLFHHLENWEINSQIPGTTLYILKMQALHKHNISLSYRLAGGNDPFSGSKGFSKKTFRPEFASKIIKAFLDALYGFLDGFVHLASDDWKLSPAASDLAKLTHHEASNSLDVDLTSTHTRLLLVLSNLNYLRESVVPQMFTQMETGLGYSTEEDQQSLEGILSEVDKTLFDDYVKQKASTANQIMRVGILDQNINWFETPPPTEVRAYVFDVLMFLVEVHAHVSNVAKPLLERILKSLIEDLVENSLECFKQIRRFGMGGMLRATLEIEFIHQVLFQYVTPQATEQLNEIYQKISESYAHRPGDENLQTALTEVKKTLNDTRKATGIEFLCFRGPSRKSDVHASKKR